MVMGSGFKLAQLDVVLDKNGFSQQLLVLSMNTTQGPNCFI